MWPAAAARNGGFHAGPQLARDQRACRGRHERHVAGADEDGLARALERVHDARDRMTRLVGLVPALGAFERRQLGVALADHRHALASGAQRVERIGDQRATGEQRGRLRAPHPRRQPAPNVLRLSVIADIAAVLRRSDASYVS